jgi:hypothetical protein
LIFQANLPETSQFFVCRNGFGEHLFQMLIVLGMYNFFGSPAKKAPFSSFLTVGNTLRLVTTLEHEKLRRPLVSYLLLIPVFYRACNVTAEYENLYHE